MAIDYNYVSPILLGILSVGFVLFKRRGKKKKLSLFKTAYIFLMGSIAYGGIASLFLGITGNVMFSDTIDSNRLWIALAGVVLLWMFQDAIRKEY